MNYIEQTAGGAAIGRALAFSVQGEVFAQNLYQQFIATPERAPTSPISSHMIGAAAGAGAIASVLASATEPILRSLTFDF